MKIIIPGGLPVALLLLVAILFAIWYLIRSWFGEATYEKNPRDPRSNVSASSSSMSAHLADRVYVPIFYGSQTGTAQRFAETLAKDGRRNGLNARAIDLAQYPSEDLLRQPFAIFCMASYGEGEPTDNAISFYDWLHNDCKNNMLRDLEYAMFSLGDSTYKHFHRVGRTVDLRLSELGAVRIYPRGEGDANSSLEDDFSEWRQKLWPILCAKFGTLLKEGDDFMTPSYKLVDMGPSQAKANIFPHSESYSMKTPYWGRVLENRELLKVPQDRSTRHVVIEIPGSSLRYDAGDHLGVMPCNDPELVERFISAVGLDRSSLDVTMTTEKICEEEDRPLFAVRRFTLRNALNWYLDLSGLVKKPVLHVLSLYAEDPGQKRQLEHLSENSDAGKELYQKEIRSQWKSVVDVLEEFDSVRPNLAHLFQVLPRQQPRYYSIASDFLTSKDRVAVTVAVVTNVTPSGRLHRGVASNFLARCQPGDDSVPIFVRKSTFHLPRKMDLPVVMIGPGTGIAPFMGFLERRAFEQNRGTVCGPCTLFFGCRRRDEDYIYENELEDYARNGVISSLSVAFSRDGPKKDYVQHHLAASPETILSCIQSGGTIYVCGDARHMASDVDKTIASIFRQSQSLSEAEAQNLLEELLHRSQYLRDVWSPS